MKHYVTVFPCLFIISSFLLLLESHPVMEDVESMPWWRALVDSGLDQAMFSIAAASIAVIFFCWFLTQPCQMHLKSSLLQHIQIYLIQLKKKLQELTLDWCYYCSKFRNMQGSHVGCISTRNNDFPVSLELGYLLVVSTSWKPYIRRIYFI